MLSSRQRVTNALYGRETDRMPWAPLIDGYYIAYMRSIGRRMDVVECVKEIGADIIERHIPCFRYEYSGGVERKESVNGDMVYTEIITPVGNLTQTARYIDNSSTIIDFMIKYCTIKSRKV